VGSIPLTEDATNCNSSARLAKKHPFCEISRDLSDPPPEKTRTLNGLGRDLQPNMCLVAQSVGHVGQGFSPLDEELGLLPASLTPLQQEHLVHLALWVSFPKAIKLRSLLMGVQVSEATARRQTEGAGAAYEAVQDEQASHLVHEQEKKSKKGRAKAGQPNQRAGKEPESKLIRSHDGAMVPLVGGVWAEAKTVVIGQVKSKEKP
jgi:hypothetical protein